MSTRARNLIPVVFRRDRDLVAQCKDAGAVDASTAKPAAVLCVEQDAAWRSLIERGIVREDPPGHYHLDLDSYFASQRLGRRIFYGTLLLAFGAFVFLLMQAH